MKANTNNTTFTSKCLGTCQKIIAQIEKAKDRILAEFRDVQETHGHLLHLALNEAEALAWETSYPHLVFADLATEKVQAVAAWSAHQRAVRGTNRVLAVQQAA